ncbi:MAG: phytanoyl-CoA dioxygenase family protein, partial [Rhodoferax sp.]|nr:phytanoyl-CoA dioxygenase family protein [Rhodoferax sp.]
MSATEMAGVVMRVEGWAAGLRRWAQGRPLEARPEAERVPSLAVRPVKRPSCGGGWDRTMRPDARPGTGCRTRSGDPMLTADQISRYHRDGYLVVPRVIAPEQLARLRAATDELVARSAQVSDHDALFDLEPGHSAAQPRVRRLKNPDHAHPAFAEVPRHPGILA